MSERPIVLVGAALATQPGRGGHAWMVLHWLLGLRAVGYRPLLIDRLPIGTDRRSAMAWLHEVLDPHDLDVVVLDDEGHSLGLDRAKLLATAADAVALINVMGYVDDEELLAAVPHRVFVDIDPGFGQFWWQLGLADVFAGHDAFCTVGLNIGKPDCRVPTCGRTWVTTLPPIVASLWSPHRPPRRGVTTVATWRGIFGPIDIDGETFGLRVHEFRRFIEIARHSPIDLEPALDLDPADLADRRRLLDAEWRLSDPHRVAGTAGDFAEFVSESTAELCIAKQLYVAARTGWFSDRSACYLAAGRPVIAQDTGFVSHVSTGRGLLTFSEPEEALRVLGEVVDDWADHAAAARALAERSFDASVVLPGLLADLGVERP